MIEWHFNPDYAGGETERAFSCLDAVFSLHGERVARDPLSQVLRVEVGGRRYYVKRYVGNGKNLLRRWFGLRALFGTPRVQREWENLRAFQAWGVPTATLVAYGMERRYGFFRRGALVTEELRDTVDLARMARDGDPRLSDRAWVAQVAQQIAQATRRLHAAGFTHNDLKWRNLLVDGSASPTVYLIDCPWGGRWCEPFLAYRKIKDLACLDKLAKYHLSAVQRLRFYLAYTGKKRLTAADKRCIRKILGFFAGRE